MQSKPSCSIFEADRDVAKEMWEECEQQILWVYVFMECFWNYSYYTVFFKCQLGAKSGLCHWIKNVMWSTGEGNGKSLQYSCLENPMNSMKRQNDRIQKEELPSSLGSQYATGDQWRNNSRRMKGWSQSKNNTQLWMWLVIEARSDAIKSNIA